MRRTPNWLNGKAGIVIAVLAGLGWILSQAREKHGPPTIPASSHDHARPEPGTYATRAGFDFYLLALTWHPAFCLDGHGNKPECRKPQPHPLAIHGLWPERLAAGAYPRDCRAPRLELAPALARELEDFMPGMESNLHDHEWRTHGGCSGLDDDVYFQYSLDRARDMDTALRRELTTLAGRETTPAQLRAVADGYQPGLGATIVFQCRTLRGAPATSRNRPFLIEVRQCIDDDGPGGAPGTLLDCSSVNRRDQGCGRSFLIAEPVR
jgi:ribonuclease I